MKPISSNLVDSLKTLGLTEYEAKVYSALVLFDRAEVKQIYEYLDAPKPSVYQSLKTLMDKGLVQVVNAKPAVYRATPPKIAIKHLTEIHRSAEEAALQELEELEQSRIEQDLPDMLWTVYGEVNIGHSIEEMLTDARRSVKLILPDAYLHHLEHLRDREITVDLITFGADLSIPGKYGLKYLTMKDAFGVDLHDLEPILKNIRLPMPSSNLTRLVLMAVDDDRFMYVPPLPSQNRSGITTSNPMINALAQMVFQTLWERMPFTYPESNKPGHHP
ncbi:putative transcription regulator (TrmB family) [Methanocella arvoryzae MRE50]|uniref:Transcription regulator (TrmB family) n=2 Tax=Methanocella TaxID=570266 RepID=Q0W543_METAR|nr:putative transcription regulator (TrmB family) [Methanocella arvoryzae MRE50]